MPKINKITYLSPKNTNPKNKPLIVSITFCPMQTFLRSITEHSGRIALSLISNELKPYATVFLSGDDTPQEKFGNQFDCYSKFFDHAGKNDNHYFVSVK